MTTKRITSQDVADAAGVSRTTVSLVLNEVPGTQISAETRQRVLAAAKRLDYVPDAAARALASRRSKIIGLVLVRSPRHIASDGFLTQILDGLVEVTRQHGLRLLLDIVEPEHQKKAYLEMVRAKHIDGVILSGPRFDDDALHALEEEGVPMVVMGQIPGSDYCSVDIDNQAAARSAVAHLVGLGHARIACITNAHPSYTAAADRLAGYRQALREAGLAYDEALVRYGDFILQSGRNQMLSLLDSGIPFSAVFVASDEVALGAKAALRERGLCIPQDVALVGFDNLPLAYYLDPPLSTVHVPAVELARTASEMLITALQGEKPFPRQVLLETHLIVRMSCGKQRHNQPAH